VPIATFPWLQVTVLAVAFVFRWCFKVCVLAVNCPKS